MTDVTDGWEFCATLQLRTPLVVLRRHGEHFPGPAAQVPKIASQADGIWVPKLKSWKELGIDLRESSEGEHATDIGALTPSEYLPFLIAFRKIIESDAPFTEKLAQLQLLPEQSEAFRSLWARHRAITNDFPNSFFIGQLTQVPGIGTKGATNLYRAGLRTIQEMHAATDADLLAVPGIGKTAVQHIRSHQGA